MSVSATRGRRPARLLLPVALGAVVLQFDGDLRRSVLALALWLGALACFEPGVLRRLWLPKFWLMTVIVAAASGLLLGEADIDAGPIRLSRSGLEAGALMVVRAAFVLALTSWVGRWARRQDLRAVLERLGFRRLGNALTAAFGLLPELSQRLRQANEAGRQGRTPAANPWRRFEDVMVSLLRRTAELAEAMAERPDPSERNAAGGAAASGSPIVFAVVAAPGRGKTTLVRQMAHELEQQGVPVVGVVQPALSVDGRRGGYQLRDVHRGEQRSFATRRAAPAAGFDFEPDGWEWAARRITERRAVGQVVVVDELGRLEAEGRGHLPALLEARGDGATAAWVLAVRADCVDAVAERIGGFHSRLDPGDMDAADAARRVVEQLERDEKGTRA